MSNKPSAAAMEFVLNSREIWMTIIATDFFPEIAAFLDAYAAEQVRLARQSAFEESAKVAERWQYSASEIRDLAQLEREQEKP